jgi:hypothetical protein
MERFLMRFGYDKSDVYQSGVAHYGFFASRRIPPGHG